VACFTDGIVLLSELSQIAFGAAPTIAYNNFKKSTLLNEMKMSSETQTSPREKSSGTLKGTILHLHVTRECLRQSTHWMSRKNYEFFQEQFFILNPNSTQLKSQDTKTRFML
jgi:ribosomal protein S14